MAFFEDIEDIIRTAYFQIILNEKKKKSFVNNYGMELNCNSYAFITKELKNVLIECNKQGFNVLDTTNKIIYTFLKKNFFIYSNHVMSTFIGYQYLKKIAQVKNPFSINGINNDSTLIDIGNHTKQW